jgi:predicted DCC family thiol-disulfide oxidoreductase YuxK
VNEVDLTPTIVIYDGECGFCSRSVQFMLRWDGAHQLRYAARQSPVAIALYQQVSGGSPRPDSIVVIHHGRLLTRWAAVLTLGRQMRFPFNALAWFGWVVPTPVGNWAYDTFAANRTRWFGAPKNCYLPTPEQRTRFLDLVAS